MNEKQQKAIRVFKAVWTEWMESDNAREVWCWKKVEEADKKLNAVGVKFMPGKGFIVK